MDKKFYFEPELEVVDLELSGMLCASGDGTDEGDEGNKGGGENEETPGDW